MALTALLISATIIVQAQPPASLIAFSEGDLLASWHN